MTCVHEVLDNPDCPVDLTGMDSDDRALFDVLPPQRNVVDLAMLVAKLARALRKAAPEHDLPARAMDYLQREGLCGSPLREAPNA